MEALRICQKPEKGILTIKLPESLANSNELEIIIIPIEQEKLIAEKKFNPLDYFGIWSDKNIDVDKISTEMRDEWDRGF